MKRDLPEQAYEWHFLTRHAPIYLDSPFDIRLMRQWVEESAGAHVDFEAKLRHVALSAITEEDSKIIRQAMQCLAHVGTVEDIAAITALQAHADQRIGRDAKTCVFEIQQRMAG